MTDEPTIRRIVRSATDSPGGTLDTSAIIAASRAQRRRPVQAITGVAAALVLGTGAVFAVGNVGSPASDFAALESAEVESSAVESSGDSAGSSGAESSSLGAAGGDAIKRAPAEKTNLCTGTLAEVAPSRFGLELTTDFPDATAGHELVAGTVTMTNTGTETVVGYTSSSPAITLSQDGVVVWHSTGATTMDVIDVTLAPGDTLEYAASFSAVVCGVDDDMLPSFRENLPAAPAGNYEVSAAIDFMGSDSADLVTGPREKVRVR